VWLVRDFRQSGQTLESRVWSVSLGGGGMIVTVISLGKVLLEYHHSRNCRKNVPSDRMEVNNSRVLLIT